MKLRLDLVSDPEPLTSPTSAAQAALTPQIDGSAILFRFPDPDGRVRAVRLYQEVNRPRPGPDFRRSSDGKSWELRWPRPPADRLEYQIEVETTEGHKELICDPLNPHKTGGPFGDKSVVELPTYRAPDWLNGNPDQGQIEPLSLKSKILHRELYVEIWSAQGTSID